MNVKLKTNADRRGQLYLFYRRKSVLIATDDNSWILKSSLIGCCQKTEVAYLQQNGIGEK
ncbi:hypothetical protein [Scytonema sp. NUACC21]